MLMIFLSLVVLLSVPLAGGDLRRLSRIVLRWTGLLPLALGLQVLVISVLDDVPHALAVAAHAASYLLAAAFVWRNRAVRGLWLLAVGAVLNAGTIALNGGTLPASATALERAGWEVEPGFANSGVLDDPVLPWLGDVFWVPAWFPFANVFSVGDVLILAGMAWVVHAACREPRSRALPVLPDALLSVSREQLLGEVAAAREARDAARDRRDLLAAEVARLRAAGTVVPFRQRTPREPARTAVG